MDIKMNFKDRRFWTTVGLFLLAAVLIVATVFMVREANRLSSITESYSEALADAVEDIQEFATSLPEINQSLQEINAHLGELDAGILEIKDALAGLESSLAEVEDRQLEIMSAVDEIESQNEQILSTLDYIEGRLLYWRFYPYFMGGFPSPPPE